MSESQICKYGPHEGHNGDCLDSLRAELDRVREERDDYANRWAQQEINLNAYKSRLASSDHQVHELQERLTAIHAALPEGGQDKSLAMDHLLHAQIASLTDQLREAREHPAQCETCSKLQFKLSAAQRALSEIPKSLEQYPFQIGMPPKSLRPAESAERGKHIPECVAFVDPFSECVCGASLPEGRAGKGT